MFENQILITFEDIKECVSVDYNVDPHYIAPQMLYVQLNWIKPLLGAELYEEIQEQVYNETLTPDNEFLLTMYIRRAQALLTVAYSIRFFHYKITGAGITINDPEPANPASGADVRVMQLELENQAQLYLTELLAFLKKNKQIYPKFETSEYCGSHKYPYRRGQLFLNRPFKKDNIWPYRKQLF